MCQSVKSTDGQLTEGLTWSLFKTTRINLVTLQTLGMKKKSFQILRTNKVFNHFKNKNHFSKIKEEFSVKYKIFFVDYYFMSYQTLKNTKNIFQKSIYGEINGV
jgi:hypothetical protein